jgi:hypothetical protein
MCKTAVEMGGGGPDALREVYESLSIGFQVNRALRFEHMMKRSLYGGLGLGGGSQGARLGGGPSQENEGQIARVATGERWWLSILTRPFFVMITPLPS